jgi:hypothetical protein
VVAAQDDRYRAARGHLERLAEDHRVAALQRSGHNVGITRIDHVEDSERLDIELQ